MMMDNDDCGAIGGMLGRANWNNPRKPDPCRFVHHKSHVI
jgi:hypothetical protein